MSIINRKVKQGQVDGILGTLIIAVPKFLKKQK